MPQRRKTYNDLGHSESGTIYVDHVVHWVSDDIGVYNHLTASIVKKYLGSVKPTPSDSACEADGRAPTSVRDTLHSDCVICFSEKEIDNIENDPSKAH